MCIVFCHIPPHLVVEDGYHAVDVVLRRLVTISKCSGRFKKLGRGLELALEDPGGGGGGGEVE